MQKITFVLPSRNNLEFLKLAYHSIRKLGVKVDHGVIFTQIKHDILILDDASVDGTKEWIESLNDDDVILYHNPGPERIGIVGMFDRGIEMARTDIIFTFHADMVAAPYLDTIVLNLLKPGTVVCATRVEPPLHPAGLEKITHDFGIEADQFDYEVFRQWFFDNHWKASDKLTEGVFAPWCMYKSDYLAIGGHDELFAPQSKEDSDLFNRFVLNGYKLVQTWRGLVYHFTSRGSRFNRHSGGAAGKDSLEWQYTTTKNARNFIRKWGHFVKHDQYMKPIVPPKYDIGFVVSNCGLPLLELLEPWCSTIYCKDGFDLIVSDYINKEQPNTKFNLWDRIKPYDNEKQNEVLVAFDGLKLDQQNFQVLQQLPEIIKDSGEVGNFQLGIFSIDIIQMNEYQNDLIICNTI